MEETPEGKAGAFVARITKAAIELSIDQEQVLGPALVLIAEFFCREYPDARKDMEACAQDYVRLMDEIGKLSRQAEVRRTGKI